MLNEVFIKKAMDATIVQADNGLWYLEPMWKQIVLDSGLSISKTTSWDEVESILKLEVQKRNTINSKKSYVINWLYDLIKFDAEPLLLEEETDYFKRIIEMVKSNREENQAKEDQN